MRDEGFRRADRTQQVGVDHPEHLLVRQPLQRTRHPVASVVEDNIDPAASQRIVRRVLDLSTVRDVQRATALPRERREFLPFPGFA